MTTRKEWPHTASLLTCMSTASGTSIQEAKYCLLGAAVMMMDTHHLRTIGEAADYLLPLFPKEFRIEAIPYDWLGLEEEITLDFLEKITPFATLWDALSEEEKRANPDLYAELLRRYVYVVASMFREHRRYEQADSRLFTWRQAGTQWLAEWEVNDLSLPNNPNKVNWHLQNTSQWRYAGCLLVQDGRVSVHT